MRRNFPLDLADEVTQLPTTRRLEVSQAGAELLLAEGPLRPVQEFRCDARGGLWRHKPGGLLIGHFDRPGTARTANGASHVLLRQFQRGPTPRCRAAEENCHRWSLQSKRPNELH